MRKGGVGLRGTPFLWGKSWGKNISKGLENPTNYPKIYPSLFGKPCNLLVLRTFEIFEKPCQLPFMPATPVQIRLGMPSKLGGVGPVETGPAPFLVKTLGCM